MPFLYIVIILIILWLIWKSVRQTHSNKNSHTDNATTNDNWEGSFWEVQQPFPVKATLRIKYEDGAGKQTERTVDVRQFGTDGSGNLLIGHCHLRNATRTFRPERIKKCEDKESGETIEDVYAYLRGKYEKSPEHTRDKLYEEEYDTLRVLLYIGKADGQLRAAEKTIIRNTCRALAKDSRITDDLIDELFSALDVPTLQAFKLAAGRLANKPTDERSIVMKAAKEMIATQKVIQPSEKDVLEYLQKRFGEMPVSTQ